MNRAASALLLCLLVLLSACHQGRHRQQMLDLLDEADSLNRAYAQLPSDSLLRQATAYFNRHGSPGDRLRANYLLGCAYRDQGQAPEALQAWQDAIDCADTASGDSTHHSLLCRVYSQMADVFHRQNLAGEELAVLEKSVRYALACGDTTAALNSWLHKMAAFALLNRPDSLSEVYVSAYEFSQTHSNYKWLVAQCSMIPVPTFLSLGNMEMAKRCISLYEANSGFVDSLGYVVGGKEIYYYQKGLYLLHTGDYKSAEMYFRRELAVGKDVNDQNAASYGLTLLYDRIGDSDSVAKYAKYSYAMNDSAFSSKTTATIERLKMLYDYSTYQKQSFTALSKAENERFKVVCLGGLLILVLLLMSLFVERWIQIRRAMIAQYNQLLNRLNEVQQDRLRLRSEDVNLKLVIEEKDLRVRRLSEELEQLRKHSLRLHDVSLETTPLYADLQKKSVKGQAITSEEWDSLNRLAIEFLPEFCKQISDSRYGLTLREYQLCLFLRIHFKPAVIGRLLDLDNSVVSRMGKSALKKLFNTDGVNKDLARLLLTI